MKERQILTGRLESILLPDVLTFISLIKKTGRLELQLKSVEKIFFVKRGEVVFAHSTDRDDSLGQFLLRNGRITREQYEESTARLQPGEKHGKLLVKMGYLTPKDLWWGVKHQVLEIIYSTFSWTEGMFRFYEMPEHMVRQSIVIGASTTSLIMEGIRRLDEWARIKDMIPNKNVQISRTGMSSKAIHSLGLSSQELRLHNLVVEPMTIEELIRTSNMSEFEVCRIVLTLLTAKAFEVHETPRDAEMLVEDTDLLVRIIHGYSELYEKIFSDLSEALSLARTREIFQEVMAAQVQTSAVFADLTFTSDGGIDSPVLLSNVADLSPQERTLVLDDALNTLLSYLLFEVSRHLTPEKKMTLYRDVSDQKARLEEITKIDDLLA